MNLSLGRAEFTWSVSRGVELRNNTIDLFEIYFQEEEPDHMPEILNLKTIALFKERSDLQQTSAF